MPWRETVVTEERMRFVSIRECGGMTMTELSKRFGISRKTAYKWWERYRESGMAGLEDRSRRPRSVPHRTPVELEAAIVELRDRHPHWGPVTLRGRLVNLDPEESWPSPSTIGAILKRHGRVIPRARRRKARHPGQPCVESEKPNDLWAADFKGEFKTRNGRYCYPLTISDHHSRYLIACQARPSTKSADARPVFEDAFARYGLPRQILTDNGTPFVSQGGLGLTRLSVWWIELGINPIRIQPGRPDQNGRHERMHRTLGQAIYPPAKDLAAQQLRFTEFSQEFNQIRPHHSLDLKPPADWYQPSPRTYPRRPRDVSYPGHHSVRRVHDGRISWRGRTLRISKALSGKAVGIEAVASDLCHVYFGPMLLGVLDESVWQFHA